MMIEHGSHCYRFADADHAQAMIDALGDASGVTAVNWGPLMEPDGEDAEGNVTYRQKKGHLVFAFQDDDPMPIEAWQQWLYKPPFWPHSFAGREVEQLACEELAPDIDERRTIPDTVVAPATRAERLAARDARLAAVTTILEARTDAEILRAQLAAANAAIVAAQAARDAALAAADALVAERNAVIQTIVEKQAAIQTAMSARGAANDVLGSASSTPAQRTAARAARDTAVAALETARTDLATATDERDRINAALTEATDARGNEAQAIIDERAARDALRDALDAQMVELGAARVAREAAVSVLRP